MNFECLVKTISPKLKAITHQLNGKYTFFNEDDLYQEALFDLWFRFNKGGLSDKTNSFILQSCYFFLKNYIRKVYKRIDQNSISLDGLVDDKDNGFGDIILKEATGEVNSMGLGLLMDEINNCLTNREKDILSLSLDNLSTREIGRKLGISHVMVVKIRKIIKDKCKGFKEEIS